MYVVIGFCMLIFIYICMYIVICLCIIFIYIHMNIVIGFCMFIFIYICMYIGIYLFMYVFIYVCLYLSIYMYIFIRRVSFIFPFFYCLFLVCLSVQVSVCLYFFMSVCRLVICQCVCLSVYLANHQFYLSTLISPCDVSMSVAANFVNYGIAFKKIAKNIIVFFHRTNISCDY